MSLARISVYVEGAHEKEARVVIAQALRAELIPYEELTVEQPATIPSPDPSPASDLWVWMDAAEMRWIVVSNVSADWWRSNYLQLLGQTKASTDAREGAQP